MSSRSSLTHAMEVQRARIAAIAGLCGATVAQDKAYPGWAPNPASPVLQVGYLQSCPSQQQAGETKKVLPVCSQFVIHTVCVLHGCQVACMLAGCEPDCRHMAAFLTAQLAGM